MLGIGWTWAMQGKNPKLNVNFRVLASGSLPGNMTFRRNNVGLESLGFFHCMAQVQPMSNKELLQLRPKFGYARECRSN